MEPAKAQQLPIPVRKPKKQRAGKLIDPGPFW
jgi:hypothetical protein